MKKYNPDWFKLTKMLRQKGIINTGLTIPYIFGAYKLLGQPFENISAMLDELRKYPIDKYPVIQKCGAIHQHVIAIEDKKIYHKNFIKDIKLRNANNEISLIISSNTEIGKTEEEVYKKLTQLYEEYTNTGKFSWNNREQKWNPFGKEEEELILSIKNKR